MKTNHLLLILCLTLTVVGCKKADPEKPVSAQVRYHCSDSVLDEKSQGIMNHLRTGAEYLDGKKLEAVFAKFRGYTYSEYAGALPKYTFRCDTSSIYDSYGYRTLVMTADTAYTHIIIYVHGGGWTFQISPDHLSFVDGFLPLANAKAYLPLYPMLPNYSHEYTMRMLLGLYQRLLTEGKPILFMGDSAGGNIILGFVEYLKSLGLKLPACVLPMSPALDLTGASYSKMMEYEKRDPILHPSIFTSSACPMWASSCSLYDPVISPIYGDLQGLPPTFLFIGTEEIFYPDNIRFAEKLAESGVHTEVLVGRGLWHVATIYDIPVTQLYYTLALDFINTVINKEK